MSLDSALDYYKRIATDKPFLAKLEAATMDERLVLLRDAGFRFTQEEFDEATRLVTANSKGELDDSQLEKVAGGTGLPFGFGAPVAGYGVGFIDIPGAGGPPRTGW
jgi:predicted ribosomally synthesized peptide with nif11-like leader